MDLDSSNCASSLLLAATTSFPCSTTDANNMNTMNIACGSANSSSSSSPPAPMAMCARRLLDSSSNTPTAAGPAYERNSRADSKCSNSTSVLGKRNFAQLAAEPVEPYVRKRRLSGSSSERSRRRTENFNEEEKEVLRININSRERRRMHDLNDALDELRQVIPYSDGSQQQQQALLPDAGGGAQPKCAGKLSKLKTIILATNWIRLLNKELAQAKAQNEKLLCQLAGANKGVNNSDDSVQNVQNGGNYIKESEDNSAADHQQQQKSPKNEKAGRAETAENAILTVPMLTHQPTPPRHPPMPTATATTTTVRGDDIENSSSRNALGTNSMLMEQGRVLPSTTAATGCPSVTMTAPVSVDLSAIASFLLGGQLRQHHQQMPQINGAQPLLVPPHFHHQHQQPRMLPPFFSLMPTTRPGPITPVTLTQMALGQHQQHQQQHHQRNDSSAYVHPPQQSSRTRNSRRKKCHQTQQPTEAVEPQQQQHPSTIPTMVAPTAAANFASVQRLLGQSAFVDREKEEETAATGTDHHHHLMLGLALSALLPPLPGGPASIEEERRRRNGIAPASSLVGPGLLDPGEVGEEARESGDHF